MSDQLWRGAIGKTYADFLTAAEHRDLVRLVQARHVLGERSEDDVDAGLDAAEDWLLASMRWPPRRRLWPR